MANDLFVDWHCMYTWLMYQAHHAGHMLWSVSGLIYTGP
jgi:hypothetical protein